MKQLLGRGRPNPFEEKEFIYYLKQERGQTLSKIIERFKIGSQRMKKILENLRREDKIQKVVMGNHVYYKVKE